MKNPPKTTQANTEAERKCIFDIYKSYEKRRRQRQEWDRCDAAINIWNRYLKYDYSGREVTKFLSDESQDLM